MARRSRARILVAGAAAIGALVATGLGATSAAATTPAGPASPATQCAPAAAYPAAPTSVSFWSTEARCAIVPPGPNGAFGTENFGNKFPGDAAVYMGIVQVAIYDAAVAVYGGYQPYAPTAPAPAVTSIDAAVATAAHDTLAGLQPQLGGNQAIVDNDYTAYLAALPHGTPTQDAANQNGIAVGHQAAAAVLALRVGDGRGCSTVVADLNPPAPGPGVWKPNPSGQVLGLCLPGTRPLALKSASQFRPDGPNALTSAEYAADLNQVQSLGAVNSTTRTPAQTDLALFWTDHDTRQWNEALLALAQDRGLDLMQTARMLVMADVSAADGVIACFDAKYHFWFWRPYQAIAAADTDGNPATVADPSWAPLSATPNFPEYPSGHACYGAAVVGALDAFFGTDKVDLTVTSRAPGLSPAARTASYTKLHDVEKDVDWARVLVGFHFRNSDLQGSTLGRKVAGYVTDHYFQPTGA
jgi:hypothetical protein